MALKLPPKGTANEAKETTAKKVTTEKAAAVQAADVPVSDTPEEVFGSKSDTLEFVAALGDPSRDDVTPKIGPDGTEKKSVDPTIVGYAFKSKEAIEIPDFGTPKDLKKNAMGYENLEGSRKVKAGEVFYLTRMETGALLSRDEYSGRATAGDMPVTVVYGTNKKVSKTGQQSAAAAGSEIPSISLRAINPKSSIKDIKMIHVLESTKDQGPGGRTIKKRTLNPGFEKWASLCVVAARPKGARTGAGTKPASLRNEKSIAFRAILEKKKAQEKAAK